MNLMQKSLTKFVENRPLLAEGLGITEITNNRLKSERSTAESDSDSDIPKAKRRERKNYNEDDDDYAPDTFSALVGSNRGRRQANVSVKPDPVVVKPKLRRVEKKFVPVLEKLSIEELMETNTFHRFNRTIENVLKATEELDFTEISKFFAHASFNYYNSKRFS